MTAQDRLAYLSDVLRDFCREELQFEKHLIASVSEFKELDIERLASSYKKIAKSGDSILINSLIKDADLQNSNQRLWLGLHVLLLIFERLAELKIHPFATGEVQYIRATPKSDWSALPPKLQYVIPDAERYGKIKFESSMEDVIASLSRSEKLRLVSLGKRMDSDAESIEQWLNVYSMRDYRESELIYFLGMFIDLLDASVNEDGLRNS